MSGHWINKGRREGIYERDGRSCLYCGRTEAELTEASDLLTLDHILAREHGGSNASSNLVTSCRCCNSSKQERSMRSFFVTLRQRGIDTSAVSKRIGRQRRLPVDIGAGKAALAAKRAA